MKNNNSHESNQLLLVSSLVIGDCILVRLRCYNPKNFQVYMSSIHIDFGIEAFVQKHCYSSFSGPNNYYAITAWIVRNHNNSSSLRISVYIIIGTATISTSPLTRSHLNIFMIWNFRKI